MPKIYFTADTHFGESNIIKYENRPFKSNEEMNSELVKRWNSVVSEDDTVYHLGDVGDSSFVSKLNGKKYLIKGNHDINSNEEYRSYGFAEVYDHPIILDSFWILSHEPLYVNTNMPYANLFGHVHASPIFKNYSPQHYCVCVERTDYAPIEFSCIKQIIQNQLTDKN